MSSGEQLSMLASPAAPPAQRNWTGEQRAAIEAAGPFAFCEAGAGSGKTGVLVERYCNAIERAGQGVDGVLAFTFTEKAAAELRARIRARLRERAAEAAAHGDAERAHHLITASREPGALVTTIHGFCNRLISSHPIAAGIDPRFRVLDAAETALLADAAYAAAFERFLADPDPARLAIAAARRPEMLRDLVIGAHEQLRSLGEIEPELPPAPEADLPALFRRLRETAERALSACADSNGRVIAEDKEAMIRAIELEAGGELDLDALVALKPRSNAGPFKGPEVAAYKEAIQALIAPASAGLYEAARELIAVFGTEFAAAKRERSGVDFEDLQLLAVRMLQRSQTVRERWGERLEEILVDEFQDTNRLQVALVEQLCGPGTTLFTVGDEFQSIYGFRNADIDVFRSERGRGEVVRLSGNFRSTPAVLSLVNAVGSALLPGFSPLVARREPEGDPALAGEIVCVGEAGWDGEDVGLADRGALDAAPHRIAEAAALAAHLRELCESGQAERGEIVVLLRAFTNVTAYEEALERAGLRPLVVGGRGYWSHQQVEDMRALLGVIANPLDDERLLGALASPACAAGPGALWLLRRAAGPTERLWPLLSRWSRGDQLGDEAAAALSALSAEDEQRLRKFSERLVALRRRARALPLDTLVERAAEEFGYDLAALSRPRGNRRWANVRKLVSLARSYEVSEGRDLDGFLAAIDRRGDRDQTEPEAATELEGHDGVRLMTIHNAKGLEFEIVAVADLGRRLNAGGFPPAFRARHEHGPDGERTLRTGLRLARAGGKPVTLFELDALADEAAAAAIEEECRLAYVAASRARRRLILSGSVDLKQLRACDPAAAPAGRDSVLVRLLAALGVSAHETGLAGPAGEETGDATRLAVEPASDPSGAPAVAAAHAGLHWLSPAPGRGHDLMTALAPAREEAAAAPVPPGPGTLALLAAEPDPVTPAGHLSHSALADFERCGYRFYTERILGLGRIDGGDAVGEALGFGSAAHSLLEWSAHNRWSQPERSRAEQALAIAGLEPEQERVERLLAMVNGFCESALCAEIRRGRARTTAEAPFMLALGPTVLRGKLDLLVRRTGDLPLVIDYKTNRLGDLTPEQAAERYTGQRDLYALAAAGEAGAETAFVFLEQPDAPVRRRHDPGSLAPVRERLGTLIGEITRGRFEVTPNPHRALCRDCPAREGLCSHPREMTLREDPD